MGTNRRTVLQALAAGGLSVSLAAVARTGRRWRAALATGRWTEDSPARSVIGPQRVHVLTGKVRNPDGLVRPGTTVVTVAEDGPATVVLDYGRIVGGRPLFEVLDSTGEVRLRSIYSQALPWLFPDGDGPAPGKPGATAAAPKEVSFVGCAGAADLSRVEWIPLRKGRILNRLIQGGQRFQALQFTGRGTVSLRRVGLLPTFRQERAGGNQGSFECSDAALTEIWSLGAYALDVASLPAGALPPIWQIGPDGATVWGDTYTGYQRGLGWTDYTVRFKVRIDANEASWLVRAQLPDGIRCVLCARNDTLTQSAPNTLRIYVQFTQQLILTIRLPFVIREHEWYAIETTVRGRAARVSIGGVAVASFEIPAEGGFWGNTSAGWVALANASGALATFRDLEVRAPDGAVLLDTPLTDAAILDEFLAGTNPVPTIVDGATRDRQLFTGDLGVAADTLLYSNHDLAFLSGSIGLFSRYQRPDGAIATSIPPQANPRRTPGNAFVPGIPDYTVQHVSTIHAYWWHTGDEAFLKAQWPVVVRVLEYLRRNVDPAMGLFAPRGPGPAAERVAEALPNIHYYGALGQAAQMALAVGEAGRAESLRVDAVRLRAAINRHLFNDGLGLYGAAVGDLQTISEHANAYAVLYGVADRERVPELLARLAAALHAPAGPMRGTAANERIVSPYTAGYEVRARLAVGDTSAALDLIRRAWAPMRRGGEYYSGATWEYVGLDGRPGLGSGTSLAHPWSSGPTSALSAYVLGVRPLAPGFVTWLVEPQLTGLRWARGAVPTPRGPLRVRWRREGKRLALRVRAPVGTRGFVGLPVAGSADRIVLDGRRQMASVTPEGHGVLPGYRYVGPLGGGVHEIAVYPG